MGSCDFARRYFHNRCFFLFLRLLRCFSSAGSLRMTMDLSYGTYALRMWVSPFGDPRINAHVQLPAAFRSLSRPSSAPSARASTLCSFCLTASQMVSVPSAAFFFGSHIKKFSVILNFLMSSYPSSYLFRMMRFFSRYSVFMVLRICSHIPDRSRRLCPCSFRSLADLFRRMTGSHLLSHSLPP